MTRTTTSRPRMAAVYAPGTVRARRWHGEGDVRGYRSPSGWTARADLTDIHPITGRALARAMGWIQKIRARLWPRPVLKPTAWSECSRSCGGTGGGFEMTSTVRQNVVEIKNS